MLGEDLRHFLAGGDVAHEREVGVTGVEALIRGGLRGDRTGERRDGREGQKKNDDEQRIQTSGHGTTSLVSSTTTASRLSGSKRVARWGRGSRVVVQTARDPRPASCDPIRKLVGS